VNATVNAVRAGLSRGLTELWGNLTSPNASSYVVTPAILVAVLFTLRDKHVDGTTLSLATLTLPSVLGTLAAYWPLVGIGYYISAEREDGTLLRAKAVPNGMAGYITGGILRTSLETVLTVLVMLIPSLFVVEGLDTGGAGGLLVFLGVLLLGLLATLPLGMIIGSVMTSPRAVSGWGFLIVGGLVAISGIFYPITALAGWLQVVGQIFPVYWLGLGMRAAFLPDAAAAVELGGSWRYLGIVGVLLGWAVVGLLLAPVILRRMARRESGSKMAQRRQKVLQRV
jgi:ABC-2 type transport system permease protein